MPSIDLSQCHKLGFKNVQARKWWHGRFGFLSHDPQGRPDRRAGPLASSCLFPIELPQPTPDPTKFLSASVQCDYANAYYYRGVISGTPSAATVLTAATVGRCSGVITQTAYSGTGDAPSIALATAFMQDYLNLTADAARTWYEAYLAQWTAQGWTLAETLTSGTYSCTAIDGSSVTRGAATLNLGSGMGVPPMSGAFAAQEYDSSANQITDDQAAATNISFTRTKKTWLGSGSWPTMDYTTEGYQVSYTVTASLSSPYTNANLLADIIILLALWPLNDDIAYPWRHDELCSIAPLCNYNEVQAAVSPVGGLVPGFADPNSAAYDGSESGAISGAPLTVIPDSASLEGIRGPHFDFTHTTWRACKDDAGHVARYKFAYGAWSGGRTPNGDPSGTGDATDLLIPITAPRWTENYGSPPTPGYCPPGAWLIYNPQVGADSSGNPIHATGCLIAQKWAEIKNLRPSINFARGMGVPPMYPPPSGASPWNDDQSKGDYYLINWAFNYRDIAEWSRLTAQLMPGADCPDLPSPGPQPRPTQASLGMPQPVASLATTEACLPFAVCCPQIICLSPNAETWTNGATCAFPDAASFAPDERYGAQWQACPVTEIPDPFWNPPAPPSGCPPCTWTEDDGSCAPDACVDGAGPIFYPHAPHVEARCSLPAGAPALPSGISIHVLSISELNATPVPPGLVVPPLAAPGYADPDAYNTCQPNPVHTPWGLWLRELGCVCAQGRFAATYQANAVNC